MERKGRHQMEYENLVHCCQFHPFSRCCSGLQFSTYKLWTQKQFSWQCNTHSKKKIIKTKNKYVNGDWPLVTHADATSIRHMKFHERSGVTNWHIHFTCWPFHPILGFWGSKVPQNGRFPPLDATFSHFIRAQKCERKQVEIQTGGWT